MGILRPMCQFELTSSYFRPVINLLITDVFLIYMSVRIRGCGRLRCSDGGAQWWRWGLHMLIDYGVFDEPYFVDDCMMGMSPKHDDV